MKALTTKLFKGLKDPEAKVRAIQGYFMREGFRAVSAEDDPDPKGESVDQTLPPIERFLFVEKNGHCELFSSAMAILLRLGGVPTRLIAGFRINRDAIGDVLTVRQADAHAWVEAYLPGIGWRPYDPTPKILRMLAITDWIRDSYDWASAKWTQYILNYGEGENSIRAQWESLKRMATSIASGENPLKTQDTDGNTYLFVAVFTLCAGTTAFAAVALIRVLRRRKQVRKASPWVRSLVRERARFERRLERPTNELKTDAEIQEWYDSYERARFGIVESDRQEEILADLRSRSEKFG
jgi:hypothetical protein